MIGTVLKELKESAEAQLPDCIDLVTGIRAVELEGKSLANSFTVYDWQQVEGDVVKVNFPALAFDWLSTTTGQRNGSNQRKAKHRISVGYEVRSADMAYIRRHMLYVPEAILLWLDEIPTASRVPGAGLTITGLDAANDSEIEITHDIRRTDNGVFIWAMDLDFIVSAIDQKLPARSVLT